MPKLENIRVYRSPVHGYGVVARRDIRTNEVIAEVEGVLYRKDEIGDDTYCLWIDGEYFFDMVDQTRWINHSCDPNAEVDTDLDGEGGAWGRITALRDIRAGEEITYHYGFSQEVAEPCRCGAAGCSGWIVDPDEMAALVKRLAREKRELAAGAATTTPAAAPAARRGAHQLQPPAGGSRRNSHANTSTIHATRPTPPVAPARANARAKTKAP